MSSIKTYTIKGVSPTEDSKEVTGTNVSGDKRAIDVAVKETVGITGTISISGLNIAGRNTTLVVGDTAIALPATPLALRNAMAIHNLDENADTLFVGFSASVTADRAVGTDAGFEVGIDESYQVDITPNIILFGIAPTGKTIKVKIQELS